MIATSAKNKQEVLSLSLSHAIVIRGQRYSGDVSKMRRLRSEALTALALADDYTLSVIWEIKRASCEKNIAEGSRVQPAGRQGETSSQELKVQ